MTSNSTEFCCSDCDECYKSASQLLTHFAIHASQNLFSDISSFLYESKNVNINNGVLGNISQPPKTGNNGKTNIPDLYPINSINKNSRKIKTSKQVPKIKSPLPSSDHTLDLSNDNEKSSSFNELNEPKCLTSQDLSFQSGNEQEEFSPLRFCSVTMEETKPSGLSVFLVDKKETKPLPESPKEVSERPKLNLGKKKYPCSVCLKVFGWSTDLKRHILTHTGERPFKCNECEACFTRNFLLQKHITKAHVNDWKPCVRTKSIMPSLQPINKMKALKKNSHKKNNDKRYSELGTQIAKNFSQIHKNLINLSEKSTLVQ